KARNQVYKSQPARVVARSTAARRAAARILALAGGGPGGNVFIPMALSGVPIAITVALAVAVAIRTVGIATVATGNGSGGWRIWRWWCQPNDSLARPEHLAQLLRSVFQDGVHGDGAVDFGREGRHALVQLRHTLLAIEQAAVLHGHGQLVGQHLQHFHVRG